MAHELTTTETDHLMTTRPTISAVPPVADEPSANAPTYAEVLAEAATASAPYADTATPPGTFAVTTRSTMWGDVTYYFAGELADPDARVVARTLYTTMAGQTRHHYVGGGFAGGTLAALAG